MKTLYLVIPCYNEEEVLGETSKRLLDKMESMIKEKKISKRSKIMFCNDGSKDRTWEIIQELHELNDMFCGISLSRNRGHQNVLLAGLMTAKEHSDITISLDADLQDDINAIDKFVDEYEEGYDIVYGVRSARTTDTKFKRGTAQLFYKLMKSMGVDIINDHADYRLMSKRALDEFENLKEVHLFLRGMVPLLGFKTSTVTYERQERFAGESKYPLKKMLQFAINGITSFSVKPIKFIFGLGVFTLFVSFALMVLLLVRYIVSTVDDWFIVVSFMTLFTGLIVTSIGVVGEYVGKIFEQSKERPRFIIKDILM